MADYDGAAVVRKYCSNIADRVYFDANLSQTDVANLSCAIVFVHAFWSIPSMRSLIRLAHILEDVDPDALAQLIVCDIDFIPDLSTAPWRLRTTGGIGEMLWTVEENYKAGGKSMLSEAVVTFQRTMANLWELLGARKTALMGSFLGYFVGILPAAGATPGSLMSYGIAKQIHDDLAKTIAVTR